MSDKVKQNWRNREPDRFWEVTKIVIGGILAWILASLGPVKIRLPHDMTPWFVGIFSYLLIAMVSGAVTWTWTSKRIVDFRELYRQDRWSLLLKLLFSLIIPIPLAITLVFWTAPARLDDPATENLFPQASDLGPTFIRTFGNNGKVNYQFFDNTPPGGPHGYARIELQANRADVEDNAGWVFYFTRGVDISNHKEIRFWIRGESGSEQIGIKMKDAQGNEISLKLDTHNQPQNMHYLPEDKITTEWREAKIPLENFPKVNFKVMDSMTFYTDGSMALTVPQTIYIGGFTLLE